MTGNYEFGGDIDLDEEIVLDKNGRRITEQGAEEIAEEVLREARISSKSPAHRLTGVDDGGTVYGGAR